MDDREIQDIVQEIDEISRELDRTHKEITRDLVSKISSIQKFIEHMPSNTLEDTAPGRGDVSTEAPKEVVIEENTIVIRQNGNTLFEGLY